MWIAWLARVLGGGQGVSAGRAPRAAARSLCLEALEDRMLLSGGPGPSSLSGSPGGPPPSSQQLVSSPLTPPSVVQNFVNQALAALGQGGSSPGGGGPGYPVPPTGGLTFTGDLMSPNNLAALPASMQGSAVAVAPVMLAGANTSALATLTPPQGYTVTLVPMAGSGAALLVVTPVQPTPAPC
jgi:hypothetical protein